MVIKNLKNTREDRRHFEEGGRIAQAAEAGKLGRSWFRKNQKTGKYEVKPHSIIQRI